MIPRDLTVAAETVNQGGRPIASRFLRPSSAAKNDRDC